MIILTSIALLTSAQAAVASEPVDQEQLIVGTIAELRGMLPSPGDAHFRRTYLRRTSGTDGKRHLSLCGQVDADDPRAPAGWIVFAAAEVRGKVMVLSGNRGIGSAASFCTPAPSDEWDYTKDLSSRFSDAMSRPR